MNDAAHDLQLHAVDELRAQLRAEQIASWIATGGIVVLAVAVREPWGLAFAAFVGAMALVRFPAHPALERGDVGAALRWRAAGTWGVAIGVTAVIPDALPIMVLNLIGPLVTGAIYLDAAPMRRLTAAGVAVAIALGALGFRSEGTGIEDGLPDAVFQLLMTVFLVAHAVVLIQSVGITHRVQRDALRAVESTNAALVDTAAELRASRRRVVAAGDDERVRLERDLHDGAQQRLVALAVQLQLAEQLARAGTPTTPDQLAALHTETREAIAEVREIARGIYPPLLKERGLPDALRSIGERAAIDVTVDADPSVRLDRTADAAVYFICLEALQNAAKHAPDATARVTLRADGDDCVLEVRDDGPGFDRAAIDGSRGLLNMADRAGALGGHLTIDTGAGTGTCVTVRLPLPARASLSR